MGYKRIFSNEQEAEAVKIALDGGNPLKYLEEHGSINPPQKWYEIKVKVKERDPETYAKLPKRLPRKDSAQVETQECAVADAMAGMKDAADTFFDQCAGMGLRVETPEQPKIVKLVTPDLIVSAIRHKKFGEFYHDFDHNCIDWRTPEGEEVSMSIPGVKELYELFPDLMKQLGVKL